MNSNIDENIKENLIDLITQLDNDLSDLIHSIEQDYTIQDESWDSIESRSSKLFSLITQIKEEVSFS